MVLCVHSLSILSFGFVHWISFNMMRYLKKKVYYGYCIVVQYFSFWVLDWINLFSFFSLHSIGLLFFLLSMVQVFFYFQANGKFFILKAYGVALPIFLHCTLFVK